MKVSISRSVGRAFEVMEVFRRTRRPATATEIRQEMACPHSSVVAVLHNLVDLGYLSYNGPSHLYFPTGKLSALGTWVQPALKGSGRLRSIADAIAQETGHSTAITCRSNIFVNIIYAKRGHHAQAEQLTTCIGVPLARSIPGIAILSQMTDEDIQDTVQKIAVWSAKARADQTSGHRRRDARGAPGARKGCRHRVSTGRSPAPAPSPCRCNRRSTTGCWRLPRPGRPS